MSTDVAFGLGLILGSLGWLIRDLVGLFAEDRRTAAYAGVLDREHQRPLEPLAVVGDEMDPIFLEALAVGGREVPEQRITNGEDYPSGWRAVCGAVHPTNHGVFPCGLTSGHGGQHSSASIYELAETVDWSEESGGEPK